MNIFQAIGEVASSVLSAAGDAIETAVNVVTDVVEDIVHAVADGINTVLDGAQDWLAMNAPYWLTAIANVLLGLVKGFVSMAREWTAIVIDMVRNTGRLLGALLALDMSGALRALLDLLINIGEHTVWLLRTFTLAPQIAATAGYFERDRDRNFIRDLIEQEFDRATADAILERLGWGTTQFGLRMPVDVRLMAADSDRFPLAEMHRRGELDLYTMAGLLSTDSLRVLHERTSVVHLDEDGNEMWYRPVTRWDVSRLLEGASDAPRLRAYAMTNSAAGEAMRFAKEHYRTLCLDLQFDPTERFSRFQHFPVQDCTTEDEFLFYSDADGSDDRTASHEGARWFADHTDQDGSLKMDHRVLGVGIFAFRRRGLNGRVYGRELLRSSRVGAPCRSESTLDTCISNVQRVSQDHDRAPANIPPDTPTGSGCTWRDTYPPYFSKVVLAHEIGHWFGLCHAGHDGVQHIMFSRVEHHPLSWDSWRLWLHGGPTFNHKDLEHTWRFIVKRLPHIL